MGFFLAVISLLAAAAPPARALSLDEIFRSKLSVESRDKTKAVALDKVVQTFNDRQKAAASAELGRYRSSKDLATLQDVAKGYMLLGDPVNASTVAESIKTLYPNDPSGYRIAADAAYRRGSYQDAADQAAEALQRNPKDASAMTILKLAQGQGARLSTTAAQKSVSVASAQQGQLAPGERIMSAKERAQLEAVLTLLARTETGRELIQEVLDKTGGQISVQKLAENGVEVRSDDKAQGLFAKVRQEGRRHIISMPQNILNHKKSEQAAAAASTTEALEQVVVMKKEGEGFSFVVMKEKTVLYAIFVYEDLKSAGEGSSGDSCLSQGWNLLSRIWEDYLLDNPAQPGEFTGPYLNMFYAAQQDESGKGVKGTAEIYGNMLRDNVKQDVIRGIATPAATEFRQELTSKDNQFRADKGYTLK